MVGVAVAVAIIAVIVIIVLAANRSEAPGWVQAIVIAAVVSPFTIGVFIRYTFWKEVVDAVEVTETQYPELYAVFAEQVRRGDFDYMPRLYIKNGNGLLNAFASKSRLDITKCGYVVIYSDIVDTFYDLGNVDTVRFVISHELGRLKLGHVHVRRAVLNGVLRPLFLHDTLTRAQEYSADRFGASINGPIAMRSLAVLTAGKRNYESTDLDAYIDNDAGHINRFWVAIINFRANHAVGRRRLAAARRMDREGWQDVHGQMF